MQGDLLVHVLEEMQDAREVVVDHEVLDPVEQDEGSGSVGHEVRNQVAQAVQVVRIDVVLAQRRREPDDADVLVSATPDDVVRMLARDVHRTPAGVDRLLERREGLLRLLLLHQVGAAFFEVLLLPEEKVLEKLVLLEGEQERPREPPHGTALPSGSRFLYVSYRLSHLRLIWAQSVAGRYRPAESRTPGPQRGAAGRNLYRAMAFRPLAMAPTVIGIIGGSALGDAFELEDEQAKFLVTPHGAPSDPPRMGKRGAVTVIFLPRHGKDHRIPPHKLNHRANLWAMKEIGATHILATSSTGSLKTPIHPATFVVPDDFIGYWDIPTYYDDRVVHSTPSLDGAVRAAFVTAAKEAQATVHDGGTYVQTTGPRLEARAAGGPVAQSGEGVRMTMASEATLASELGIPYASLCTGDNFCNRIVDEPLTFEKIRETQRQNADLTRTVVAKALERIR